MSEFPKLPPKHIVITYLYHLHILPFQSKKTCSVGGGGCLVLDEHMKLLILALPMDNTPLVRRVNSGIGRNENGVGI